VTGTAEPADTRQRITFGVHADSFVSFDELAFYAVAFPAVTCAAHDRLRVR
jgi:hypothetical protein